MVFMKIKPGSDNEPSLLLSPDMYGPGTTMFFRDHAKDNMSRMMSESLVAWPGVGTTCMKDMGMQ